MTSQLYGFNKRRTDAKSKNSGASEANTYGNNSKKNIFSILFGLEQYTFLDICPYDTYNPTQILIERGDVVFIRNDIVHRGCENLTDSPYHQIHCFIELNNVTSQKGQVVKADGFGNYPYYDRVANLFVNPLKDSIL